ncbi:L,D-transpeptidase [Sphingobium sp. AP49]|uniref:L,D-transpeptidase n=1 Tax=Sphingobium sp. AP49 TaxID=1144307 RepID=UPI00026EE7D2|nr:L,D-transpeptidase [Sphingobium sp. AP49]WHO40678.1 L,D-transpeptidase [Sphingobium sp. AP49]
MMTGLIRRSFARHAILLAGLGLGPQMALAQGDRATSPPEFARRADNLKPGQWVWAPQVSPTGPLLVYVDLSRQIATVYRNGVRIAVSTISSGKEGHETPTGVFTILQKDKDHRSSLYNSAPMPYQQRLTWDGVALHAGGLPGYPESHGCIHLPYKFSQELFAITSLGATVVVQGNAATHMRTSQASLLSPVNAKGELVKNEPLQGEEYRWQPALAPSGPLTIIISKKEQRIVVLRNGTEIGRSVAQINDADPGSHVITLSTGNDGKPHWLYVGLPGHEEDANNVVDEAVLNRVRVPRDFYELVRAQLKPGATILVTDSSVGASTGERLTIMDAVVPAP